MLALSFAAHVAALLVPGTRRFLGIAPTGVALKAVANAVGIAPYAIGRARRVARRQRRELATAATFS
jgi:hypothetical protein